MGCYCSVHLVTDDDGKCIQAFDAGFINESPMRNCRSHNILLCIVVLICRSEILRQANRYPCMVNLCWAKCLQ